MAQTFRNIELIVVDNYSKDQTVEIARRYGAAVYSKGPERSSQRNYGAQVAFGEYLVFLDADMILTPNLLKECLNKCQHGNVDALYIPERIIGNGFWIKVRDFERSFYTGTVIDAVRFVRRDLFLCSGGFDETLIGPEDWDFDRKIRRLGRVGLVQAPVFHNEGRFNLEKYLRKKSYYGSGLRTYVRKWGSNDKEIVKQVGASYRLIGVFVEDGKWKKLASNPLYAIAMYILRLGVALSYLKILGD
jgi:glycosyltransferase involved in cell wall biosynthesis